MKIACIVTEFPVLSETFILNQITGLLDLGHDVQIFALIGSEGKTVHADIADYQLMDRIHYFIKIPRNRIQRLVKAIFLLFTNFHKNPLLCLKALNIFKYGKDAASFNLLYRLIPFLDKEFDIIQCHFGYNGNIGADLKRIGVPGKLVTMFHGNDIRLGVEYRGMYSKLFDSGDCFLVVSKYIRTQLIRFGAPRKKLIFHPVGIDIKKFSTNFQSSVKHPTPVIILTVARLVEEKGLSYGINAVHELLRRNPTIRIEYHIIGWGKLDAQLKQMVRDLKLEGIIRFLGPMTQNDVIQELNRAHIFLLPSIAEAFGLVLLEAQAVGLPVIATNVGGVSEAMIDGKSGFLAPPQNTHALVNKLEYLVTHPEVWSVLGKHGRDFVEKTFDIRWLNGKLVNIYQDLLLSAPDKSG